MILCVDDEIQNLKVLSALLEPMNCQVVSALSGEEALKMATASPPDIVLLDIMMPGISGYDVLNELRSREEFSGTPIVMVTALSRSEERLRALEAGADEFLTKPVDRTELRARVKALLKVKAYNDHLREDKEHLEAMVQDRTQELRAAYEHLQKASLETIVRLSRAAEYRDDDTGAHVVRMSRYASVVAQQMGLDSQVVEQIRHAAPMHDVGKIGIPDRILLKPGRLDAEEWSVMQRHTLYGAKILEESTSEVINLAETIARTHHERWDGAGYPEGLKGPDIPLSGRIVAVADVFDALNSRRPYKEPFPVERSLGIIRSEREKHFDPDVVDAFFAQEEDVLKIREDLAEDGRSILWLLSEPVI